MVLTGLSGSLKTGGIYMPDKQNPAQANKQGGQRQNEGNPQKRPGKDNNPNRDQPGKSQPQGR